MPCMREASLSTAEPLTLCGHERVVIMNTRPVTASANGVGSQNSQLPVPVVRLAAGQTPSPNILAGSMSTDNLDQVAPRSVLRLYTMSCWPAKSPHPYLVGDGLVEESSGGVRVSGWDSSGGV